MEGVLQFKDYHVLETHYMFNPFLDEEEERLSPRFEYSLDFPEEENKKLAFIKLGITIGDENLIKNSFFVSATILGVFSIKSKEELDEEEIHSFYKINAVAILFPYLRSLVSDLTGKGSEPPIIIPTINVVELIKKYEEEKRIEKEAQK
ncbi:hypothetical protein PB1_05120 [Bacillus methanolicus PB1]|uniref:Preprotein translocase subunit SecB n=1 Tax=Bacillus methanolicus PB1 TaxID=997296 RepID=I3E713_BACMT|nr:protein-export chaperone SecB [Bacillus methanolicus]EIJ82284.1 hypothetical protein PB1_05120 [Bacillus methanolicus PB1]